MITKDDLPRLRLLAALNFPAEEIVSFKWDEVASKMGDVPVTDTIQGIKIVLLLCKKVETILVDDVAILGQEKTFRTIAAIERIKNEATEILGALEG